MKIATLGPKGTFSHEAVIAYNKGARIVFKESIWGVFNAVQKGEVSLGVVPIENSVAGTVGATLDALMKFNLKIVGEKNLVIKHDLVGFGRIKDIKTLYLHPQTYEQCEKFIRKNLKGAEVIFTSSNGKSAQLIAQFKDKSKGTLAPAIATKIYRLPILKKGIQDNRGNATRFVVISKKEAFAKSGRVKTSVAMHPKVDKPGLLHELLGAFSKSNINLTKIESRPVKGKLGDYLFYIDFEGHLQEKKVKAALKDLKKSVSLKIFGSYPANQK